METTVIFLKKTTPHIGESLVRDEQTNELYLPLTSTVVLKSKKEKLYVPLDFENGSTKDALGDSRAYVNAISQNELDTSNQQAPNFIFKIEDPLSLQIQVAEGQLEKPLATTTLEFDRADQTCNEYFVEIKNLTGWSTGLHCIEQNSIFIDTMHVLIHFPHLTMQGKRAANETCAKLQFVLTVRTLTIQHRTTKTITANVDHPSDWKTTGTMTPLEKNMETAYLLISHLTSTMIDKKVAVRLTNATESPYLIKKKI